MRSIDAVLGMPWADPNIEVVCAVAMPLDRDVDVAVASVESSAVWIPGLHLSPSQMVRSRRARDDNPIHAILNRGTMTPEQFIAAVRAGAVGLRVTPRTDDSSGRLPVGGRGKGRFQGERST